MDKNGLYSTGKFSVNRTDAEGNSDAKGLRIFRVVIAVLIIGMIIATVTLGVFMFGSGSPEYENTDSQSEAAYTADLIRVVGKTAPLEEDYVPKLTEVDGVKVSVLCADSLREMLAAAEKEGIGLELKRGYVSSAVQQKLYEKLFNSYLNTGAYTEVRAQAKAERKIPQAGKSESQTGLLVRFGSAESGRFQESKAYSWLISNSVDYGFVLRYPADKTDETSMDANYTDFRYVGRENAAVMRSLGKCLDEYSVYVNSR